MKIKVSSGVRVKRVSATARKRPVRPGRPGTALGVNLGRRTKVRVF